MNEFLIEDENTIYEIDPSCKIEPIVKKRKKMSSQSINMGCPGCFWMILWIICHFLHENINDLNC